MSAIDGIRLHVQRVTVVRGRLAGLVLRQQRIAEVAARHDVIGIAGQRLPIARRSLGEPLEAGSAPCRD